MAFTKTIKLPKGKWSKVTDKSSLLQFKLDLSIVVFWYEDDTDPTATIPSPDMYSNVGVLNDGQTRGVGKLDKVYTNTVGAIWVYPNSNIAVTILEET